MLTDLRFVTLPAAVLAAALAVSGARAAAAEDVAAPAPSGEVATAPAGDEAAPETAPEAATGEGDGTIERADLPPVGEGGAEAPVVLDGPLRPKGSLPQAAAPTDRGEDWNRSFQGGVKWTKGDTSVTVSGMPFSGFRIGGSISR